MFLLCCLFIFFSLPVFSDCFQDLSLVEKINKEHEEYLPVFYNTSAMGGYFNMPSARMEKTGMVAAGFSYSPPYNTYGLNFQMLDRIELSANYRIFNGILERHFGKDGFGDDAERIGNIKIGILTPKDDFHYLPLIAFGANDFVGTCRFNSQYIVATEPILPWNLELSLGWGNKRIHGFFGGAAWTPFRTSGLPILENLTLMAEYDATDYKNHPHEHPKGRSVASRINGGAAFLFKDTLQLTVNSVRGEEVAAAAFIRYPFGTTSGLFPKTKDALTYKSPCDSEPLGIHRTEKEFIQELNFAFSHQGLDLYRAHLGYEKDSGKILWITLVNNRYREEKDVRSRIEHVLAALLPSNISTTIVAVEADGVVCQAYLFRREDLIRWKEGLIDDFTLSTLSPMQDAPIKKQDPDAETLFHRHKPIWTFTILPRLITFFGSSNGKFKYSLAAIVYPEGYLFDNVYYKLQLSYDIVSSLSGLGSPDRLNPSRLPNVRTDSMRYYKEHTFAVEQAFLQKTWNLTKGWFYRVSSGYFEPAYGGGATELLYYPAGSNWAIGLEIDAVMKRKYHGLKFTGHVNEFKDNTLSTVPFFGLQGFIDFYYDFKPLQMDLVLSGGRFLAKDWGLRTEVGRYFKSGMRFALWYTVTNGHDKINGSTYFDKGFSFSMPLDIFLKQSSRTYLGYAMSAWLRDVGARAASGKRIYWTVKEERTNY